MFLKRKHSKKGRTGRFAGAISILMVVAMLLSVTFLNPSAATGDANFTSNYPLLSHYSSGNIPDESIWDYSVKEFSAKADFETSQSDFAAPDYKVTATATEGKFTWTAVEGANSYKLKIFDSSNVLFGEFDAATNEVTVPNFTLGATYQAQVTAYDAAGAALCSSKIRVFEVETNPVDTLIPARITSATNNGWSKQPQTKASAPSGSAYKYTTGTQKYLNVKLQGINNFPSETQAVVFWFGQDAASDGTYTVLNYYLDFAGGTIDEYSGYAGATPFYFIPTVDGVPTGEITSSNSTNSSSTPAATTFSSKKHGNFIEGYIVIPMAVYKSETFNAIDALSSFDLSIKTASTKSYIDASGTVLQNSTAIKSGQNLYIGEIGFVTDLSDYFVDLGVRAKDTGTSFEKGTEFGCDTYAASTNTYYYANKADNLYSLSATRLTFKATDAAGLKSGLSLRFTAPKTSLYDFTQDIAVTGNSSGLTGKVYYRVVIEGSQGDVNAYPASGWHTLDVTTTTPNPNANLDPVLINLNEGQTARIEAYADIDNGEALTLWLGNPVMTEVESTESAQGTNTKYTASHYFITPQLSSTQSSKYTYFERGNRFTFKLLDATSETLAANNGEPVVKSPGMYVKSWSNALNTSSKHDGEYLGFWYMTNYSGYDNTERIKFKTKTGMGDEIGFVSPVDGTLNFSYLFTGVSNTVNVRIVKNGTVVWPEDGGWNQIKTGTINFTCKAIEGDNVNIQFYTPDSGLITGYLNPIVSVLSTDYQNSADSHIYSPLWERPYNGTGFVGDYAAYADSVFNFELFRTGDLTHLAVDKFDSAANNRLYRDDTPRVGYHFGADELTFDLFSTEYGMTYSFTAPMDGTYDFSSAFRILSGTGKVSFKVAKDVTNIYPAASSYEVIDSETDPERLIDAIEVTLKKGETIVVTAFAEHLDASTGTEGDVPTDEEESTEIDIVLGMGTPTVIRHINIERLGADTLTIYTPVDFAAFETGHSGAYINMTRRFDYSFISKADGKVVLSDTTDSNSNTISANGIGSFNITDAEVIANIDNAGYMASMKFISPVEGEGDLVFSAFAAGAAGQYKVLVNGAAANGGVDSTALPDNNSPLSYKLTLKKGDIVELVFSLDAAGSINLGKPEIYFTSRVPDYTSTDTSYNPIANNPFGDQKFEGEYVYDEVEYWHYDMMDVTDIANIQYHPADYYKSGVPNRLSSTETGTAYLLENVLNVELKDSKYGMSLGFNFPRVDDFLFHTALGIASENTTADLHARITLNGLTVWPTDSDTGWYDTTLSTGDSVISVPLYTIASTSSDELRFEVYTDNIVTDGAAAEDLVINLAIPEIYTQNATLISNDDTHTNILRASNNHQYAKTTYSGATIPAESRWNFETATFTDDGYTVRYPNKYNASTSVYSYEGETRAPTMAASKNTAVIYTGNNEGINLRFASTADAVTYYRNIPTVTPTLDTTEVYFRILLNGEKIWPEGDTEWEVLTKANKTSAYTMTKYTLAHGDDIEAQIYAVNTAGEEDTVSISWSPLATVANYYSTGNSVYLLNTGYTPTLQVSPFWSYEYALDVNNIEYRPMETILWSSWYSNKKNYIGITKDRMHIQNVSGGKYGEFETMPIASLKFTAPQDGYYKPYKTTKASLVALKNASTARIRILVNNEVVWPEEGEWFVLESGKTQSAFFDTLHLKAGDEVRFEATPDGTLPGGAQIKVKWPLGLSYSLYDQVYTSTNDIYNMLTTELYNHFKSLDSTGEFDPDFLANKRLSEILRLQTEQQGSDNEYEEDFDIIAPDAEGGEDGGSGGRYITTGGGRKKRVRRIITNGLPLWLIILIIVAAVLVVAAIVVVLIILKKKGKLTRAKKN